MLHNLDRYDMKLLSGIVALLLGITGMIGCGSDGSDGSDGATADGGEPIKIGHFASLQGPTATFGQQTDNGIKLAVAELNEKGGILGRQIELITEDTRSQAQDAGLAAEKLIGKEEVVVLLGEVSSSLSLVAAPIADREQVPMVTPASTNPAVTVENDGTVRKYVFRVCFIDPFQGQVMAKFAAEHLGAKRVAILTDNAQDYSVGLSRNFEEAFTAAGGEIVLKTAYETGQVDFNSQLTDIRQADVDAIFIPGYYTEVSLIAAQARSLGIEAPLLGGDGWDSPELVKGEFAKALEGTYFSNHYSLDDTSAAVKEFSRRYREMFDGEDPGAMSALGYDAMMLVADAIERAGTTESNAVRDAIASTAGFVGVTGAITIDDQHNAEKSAVVLEIKDGKFTYFTTIDPNDDGRSSDPDEKDAASEAEEAVTEESEKEAEV